MNADRLEIQFSVRPQDLSWTDHSNSRPEYPIRYAMVGPYTIYDENGDYYVTYDNSVVQWRVDLSQFLR